ncbi:MAG: acyltransferase [Psychroflexus halocasei]
MKFITKSIIFIGILFNPIILKLNRRVIVKGKIKIKSFPIIHLENNSRIIIGNNVTINSTNFGYHLNMYNRVKLVADGLNSKIIIGENTRIHGTCIHSKSTISIGKNCLIAANCQIIDSNGHETLMDIPQDRIISIDEPKRIIIEDNVWIGANSIILKGVTIGEGSIVAAGSVVVKSIPKKVIVGGNPAIVIKDYSQKN